MANLEKITSDHEKMIRMLKDANKRLEREIANSSEISPKTKEKFTNINLFVIQLIVLIPYSPKNDKSVDDFIITLLIFRKAVDDSARIQILDHKNKPFLTMRNVSKFDIHLSELSELAKSKASTKNLINLIELLYFIKNIIKTIICDKIRLINEFVDQNIQSIAFTTDLPSPPSNNSVFTTLNTPTF
ncbi:13398_t:CDS:2 [Entrophospora sp. SA101]|nr:2898_t:CDS:2 [Entrophospora sp. SA101]CAJ0867073.1 13398_t:CDS:2 [Entrophospora sp. SA101]